MLNNLKLLKNDMEINNWAISSFMFQYKKVQYIVLIQLFNKKLKKKNKYALVHLTFLTRNDLNHVLKVEANVNKVLIDAKTLREYFGIEYSKNLGDVLSQFSDRLNDSVPIKIPKSYFNDQKKAMVISLSKSDSENPNKKYCFAVKRNAKDSKRSEFNANKAHLLRPFLFEKYKGDDSISFCFSNNQEDERTDSEIMQSFSQKH